MIIVSNNTWINANNLFIINYFLKQPFVTISLANLEQMGGGKWSLVYILDQYSCLMCSNNACVMQHVTVTQLCYTPLYQGLSAVSNERDTYKLFEHVNTY